MEFPPNIPESESVDIAEVPFVCRDLAVGVQVPLPEHQVELLLGEVEVHRREGDGVERQVPGCVPGVFPLVRHGNHITVEHVVPISISHSTFRDSHEWMRLMLLQPGIHIVEVELFSPQHTSERLTVNPFLIFTQ